MLKSFCGYFFPLSVKFLKLCCSLDSLLLLLGIFVNEGLQLSHTRAHLHTHTARGTGCDRFTLVYSLCFSQNDSNPSETVAENCWFLSTLT